MRFRAAFLAALAVLVGSSGARAQAIIADHTGTTLSAIPDSAIAQAANLRLLVRHASVGGNINSGLDALYAGNSKYNRSRWTFENRGNPGWQPKVDDFVTQANSRASSFDVMTFKFCYIDPNASFTYYRDRLLAVEAANPSKKIVWWTIPIETSANAARQTFNDQVRAYARANNKLLFDIADIEAYNAAGQKRTDGSGRELMQPEWTSDGGHLSTAGAQRVASALWWLMARIAGWDPNTNANLPVWHSWFAVNSLETPYVGDFNGDGLTDIITFTRQNPSAVGDVYVALSDGTKFGASSKWHDWFAVSTAETVVIGDYDGDGKDDIATWLGASSRQVYVARSLGTGMTSAAVWLSSIGTASTDVLQSGDVNGDGRDDLVCFARSQGRVYVALSTGSGFSAPAQWHAWFAVSTYERPQVADVTGDGRADIVTFATNSPTAQGDVYVAISDGTRFTDAAGNPNNSTKWHDWFAVEQTQQVRIGDLNADGRDDFFTFLPAPQSQCYTVLSQGTSMAPNVLWPETVGGGSTDVPFVGDVTGDGKADIVIFAQSQGKVYVSAAK